MLAEGGSSALLTSRFQPPVLAEGGSSALLAKPLQSPMHTEGRTSTLLAFLSLSAVLADG
jgi:hypothetical protein